jgi:hypothetical protein
VARIGSVFALGRRHLPKTPKEFAEAIEEGLRAFARRPQPMVTVRGQDLRALDRIEADLSGARIDPNYRPELALPENAHPAVQARELSVIGEPLKIFERDLVFRLEATNVELHQANAADGNLLLLMQRAEKGEIRISVTRTELEQMIAAAARFRAEKQGVTIEGVRLNLTQHGPRVFDAMVTLTARKMFFRAALHLTGTVALSDQLVATLSDLRCRGDGAIATIACAAITPHFAHLEQRPFPLSAIPLGEARLRDVALQIEGEQITASALFGSASVRPG